MLLFLDWLGLQGPGSYEGCCCGSLCVIGLAVNMSDAVAAAVVAKAEAASDIYVEALILWEELDSISFAQIPVDAVKKLATEADDMSKLLVAQFMNVRNLTGDQLPEIGSPVKILDLKKLFIRFRDEAWCLLATLEKTSAVEVVKVSDDVGSAAQPEDVVAYEVSAEPIVPVIANVGLSTSIFAGCFKPRVNAQFNPTSNAVLPCTYSYYSTDPRPEQPLCAGVLPIQVAWSNLSVGIFKYSLFEAVSGFDDYVVQLEESYAALKGSDISFPFNPGDRAK